MEGLKAVINFLQMIFDWIQMVIDMTKTAFDIFVSLFSMLPWQVNTAAIVLLVVCVLYKILGRESQS